MEEGTVSSGKPRAPHGPGWGRAARGLGSSCPSRMFPGCELVNVQSLHHHVKSRKEQNTSVEQNECL